MPKHNLVVLVITNNPPVRKAGTGLGDDWATTATKPRLINSLVGRGEFPNFLA